MGVSMSWLLPSARDVKTAVSVLTSGFLPRIHQVDTLRSTFRTPSPSTSSFVELVEEELKGSSVVREARLVSDSRQADVAGEGGDAQPVAQQGSPSSPGPIRIEWEVTLARERPAVAATDPNTTPPMRHISLVYYVNEDFSTFWPEELHDDGCLAVLFASKVQLPLWNPAWVQRLGRAASASALLVADSTSTCEPPLPFFFMAAEESRALSQDALRELFMAGFVMPLMTELPLLSPTEDVIAHSSKSTPTSFGGFVVRVLCCWELARVLSLAAAACAAVTDAAGPRVLEAVERTWREYLAGDFAAAVRADGFAPLPEGSSMARLLKTHLASDPPGSLSVSLKDWVASDVMKLRAAVGLV